MGGSEARTKIAIISNCIAPGSMQQYSYISTDCRTTVRVACAFVQCLTHATHACKLKSNKAVTSTIPLLNQLHAGDTQFAKYIPIYIAKGRHSGFSGGDRQVAGSEERG